MNEQLLKMAQEWHYWHSEYKVICNIQEDDRFFEIVIYSKGEIRQREFFYRKGQKYIKNPMNPLDENKKTCLREYIENNFDKNERLRYLNALLTEERKARKIKPKSKINVGRPKDTELREMTLWAIENRAKNETVPQAIKKAFNELKPNHTYSTFNRSVKRIWEETRGSWKTAKLHTKRSVTFLTFAKKFLKSL